MKNTDVDIVSEIITRTGYNRCPAGDNIEANTPIQGDVEVVDNTVLVIFQEKESNILYDEQSYKITSRPAVKGIDRK